MKAKKLTSLFCAMALVISLFSGFAVAADADGERFGEHSAELVSVSGNTVLIKAVSEETEPFDAVLIYASYEDGRLSSVKTYNVENISVEGIQTELDGVTPEEGDKLMLWEGTESLRPIADVYKIGKDEPVIPEYKITIPLCVANLTIDGEAADENLSARSGAVVAFQVTIPEGQKISEDGVTVSGVDAVDYDTKTMIYSFVMPQQDTEITVLFEEIIKHKITFVNPAGADVKVTAGTTPVVSGDTDVAEGTEISIEVVITDSVYQLTKLSYNDGTDHDIDITGTMPYIFTMPDKAVTITALTATKAVHSIELAADASSVQQGKSTVVTAKLWSDGSEEEKTELTDVYKNQIVWKIDDASIASGASITPSENKNTAVVTTGAKQVGTVTVTASLGQVSQTISISVSEKETYAITVSEADNGTVTTSPAVAAAGGERITITAVPDEGYKLEENSVRVVKTNGGGNVEVTGNEFIMPNEPVTVSASFEAKTNSITVVPQKLTDNGTINVFEVIDNNGVLSKGGALSLEHVPYGTRFIAETDAAEGYEADGDISILPAQTAVTDGDITYYTMPDAAVTLSALFKLKKYTVTFKSDGETITTAEVQHNQTAQNVKPENPVKTGYEFLGWVKGDSDEGDVVENWEKITGSVTYTAKFSKKSYTLTISEHVNGTVKLIDAQTNDEIELQNLQASVKYDAGFQIVAEGNDGYSLKTLTVTYGTENNTLSAVDGVYKMPADNVKVTVEFERNGNPIYDAENKAVVLSEPVTLHTVVIMDKEEKNYYYMDIDSEGFTAERFLLDKPLAAGEYIIRTRMLDGTVSDAVLNVKAGN